MSKLTREEFRALRTRAEHDLAQSREVPSILICAGTGCIAGGAMKIYDNFKSECEARGLKVYVGLKHDTDEEKSLHVKMSGCHGFCEMGPLVHIEPMGVMYIHVKPEDCHEILEKTVLGGEVIDRLVYHLDGTAYPKQEDIPFYKKQHRVVLENCGTSDAEDIEEYIAKGGYSAFEKALFEMTDEQICRNILDSGLRGRGGGGFSTGMKWELASKVPTVDEKFIICNGDEGDPGAYMDRSILEGDPHAVIEGMMIAAYAIGATDGWFYVRAEYPLAVERLEKAIKACKKNRLLGNNIMGTDFCFNIDVRLGAGAFVCGEETALIHSIEGKRGTPRPRPPYPTNKGLWDKPSCVNNVETLGNIAKIILKGPEWFASFGTETSKGTKVFALTGQVEHSGLIEVPMGTTINEIVNEIGGGVPNGKKLKAVQTGGPSGGVIPAEHMDLPVCYEELKKVGSIMGSGGMIVMDDSSNMVNIANFYLDFTVDESCGKCAPCRIGGKQMLLLLEKINKGKGTKQDLEDLKRVAQAMQKASLCGLGQTAPNPVLSTLRFFENEYLEKLVDTPKQAEER